MSFNKTLNRFKRIPQVEFDCGNGFFITIRQASRHNQEFRAKAAEFAARSPAGKGARKLRVGAEAGVQLTDALTGTADPKQDAEFFYEVFVVTWRGLKDDDGKDAPPSKDAAVELFSSKDGQVLMELLLAEAVNDGNFTASQRDESERKIAGE